MSKMAAARSALRRLSSAASGSGGQPRPLRLHDVTARDGIQNEAKVLDLGTKLDLVRQIVAARPSSVEMCSFVREDLVPAMAGAKELCHALQEAPWARDARQAGIRFAGLVPNMRGYESFHEASGAAGGGERALDTLVCLVSCTESHSRANVRMPLAKALDTTLQVVKQAKADGFAVRAYASLAFQCPFEGKVAQDVVLDIVNQYLGAGAETVVLADTLGQATPEHVRDLLSSALKLMPTERLGMHMHDAHGRAGENLAVGLELGLREMDAALGGCGGCNFVPDAKGNVSTQKLLATARELGVPSNVDERGVFVGTAFLEAALEKPLSRE